VPPLLAGALPVLAAVAVGVLLTPAGNGFVERYSRVPRSTAPGADVLAWFAGQRGFRRGDGTIAFASRAVLAPLAGDHFTHRLTLVPGRARCDEVIRLAGRMPVVVTDQSFFTGLLGVNPYPAPGCLATSRPAYRAGVYRVYRVDERVFRRRRAAWPRPPATTSRLSAAPRRRRSRGPPAAAR
jgi:hypothetical protein